MAKEELLEKQDLAKVPTAGSIKEKDFITVVIDEKVLKIPLNILSNAIKILLPLVSKDTQGLVGPESASLFNRKFVRDAKYIIQYRDNMFFYSFGWDANLELPEEKMSGIGVYIPYGAGAATEILLDDDKGFYIRTWRTATPGSWKKL